MVKSKKTIFKVGLLGCMCAGAVFMYVSQNPSVAEDEAYMASLYGAQSPAITLPDQVAKPSPVVVTESVSEAKAEFVVAPDYRTALAAQKMMAMALNEDVTAAWEGLKLAANARREKANIAALEMQEAQARFQQAKYEQQTKAVQNGQLHVDGDGEVSGGEANFSQRSFNHEVAVVGYMKRKNGMPANAMLRVNGVLKNNVREGQSLGDLFIADLDDDNQCVTVGSGSTAAPVTQRYCI